MNRCFRHLAFHMDQSERSILSLDVVVPYSEQLICSECELTEFSHAAKRFGLNKYPVKTTSCYYRIREKKGT